MTLALECGTGTASAPHLHSIATNPNAAGVSRRERMAVATRFMTRPA
jgi:hypothetical protein